MDRLQKAIEELEPCVIRKVFTSNLPSLQQIEWWIEKDWFGNSLKDRNKSRFENPDRIWSPVHPQHFAITRQLESYFKKYEKHDHQIFGGLTDTPTARAEHKDPMNVLITQVYGKTPWRVFPKSKNLIEKSILSIVLSPGDCLVLPQGYWHAAYPTEKRISFSTGWI